MELIQIVENFHPVNDTKLLDRAKELEPVLYHGVVSPVGCFQLTGDFQHKGSFRHKEDFPLKGDGSLHREDIVLSELPHIMIGKDENMCLDFGTHCVGYLTLDLSCSGSHPDAPAYLELKFAERPEELTEDSDKYEGWVSKSWIQEERVHVDELPAQISLSRRYAFRYLKISVIDTSPKYKLVVRGAECRTETSADRNLIRPVETGDALTDQIYAVSIKTLADCMQSVFEDGPKRDRRLWAGDFRLQALTNYISFDHRDLVKRCLYLFAGSRFPDGRVSACVFTKPNVMADDTWFFDYALLYVVALEEYLQHTEDREALDDLYDIAMRQIEVSLSMCDENQVIMQDAVRDTFVDWCDGLDKTVCAQAILIYALRYARKLAQRKNELSYAEHLMEQIEKKKEAALTCFWDSKRGYFVSNGQVSIASQVWMVLAGVLAPEQEKALMRRCKELANDSNDYPMVSPYMHHYYLSALIRAGLMEEAMSHMKMYWGGMLKAGADTFWETWNPANPMESPYGDNSINSYCHAWSCTPAYLLRTYFLKE